MKTSTLQQDMQTFPVHRVRFGLPNVGSLGGSFCFADRTTFMIRTCLPDVRSF